MKEKKCCETCGNKTCLNMIVAVWYDLCVMGDYKFWKPREDGDGDG